MHRHDVLFGQDVVEEGEDRLLHFAGVAGAADQHDLAREVAGDDRLGAAAVPLGIGFERGQVDDREVGREGGEILARRADQQVADEQRVPGVFGEDARLDAQRRIGAAMQILREQRLAAGVCEKVVEQRVEILARHRIVVVPPDDGVGLVVADDELVFRAAAGMHAGVGDQRAVLGDMRFMALQREFVELRRAEVPVARRRDRESRTCRRRKSALCSPVSIMKRFLSACSNEYANSGSRMLIVADGVNPYESRIRSSG